jgi:hypothetical protein
MNFQERFDKIITGIAGGLLLPVIIVFIIFLFAKGDPPLAAWLRRIEQANIVTHIISICVFPNLIIFLIFNYFDMLKASKGVLAVTIAWAIFVFCVKFLL